MTDAKLIDRFLAGVPPKRKHEVQMAALWARGEILVIDGKPYRRVADYETMGEVVNPRFSPVMAGVAGFTVLTL